MRLIHRAGLATPDIEVSGEYLSHLTPMPYGILVLKFHSCIFKVWVSVKRINLFKLIMISDILSLSSQFGSAAHFSRFATP